MGRPLGTPAPEKPLVSGAPRKLLLSIHDVGPRFEAEVDELLQLLHAAAPGAPVAMLVVPDHWGTAPIRPGTPFASRLRGWAAAGTELFVHGWFHKDDTVHAARWARFKARHMTAREGEFLGIDRHVALQRMRAGKALLEDISGREAAGFVAPAWLYGAPARDTLAEAGFRLAEDHMRVWRPGTGAVVARGPVITWATRTRARRASSLAVAALARRFHPALRTLRVAVHPGDARSVAVRQSIARTVSTVTKGRQSARYAELEG